jgi:hypothetical protein
MSTTMTTPFTVKETLIEWRKLRIITARENDPNLLRPYSVFVIDGAGSPKSPTAHYATAAAADIEHQKLVRQLATGSIPERRKQNEG